jgi:hypothetical protein
MNYTLRLGESVAVRRNFLATTWSVTYAGMPADGRYAVAITWRMGHQASSYNLYFTESDREIPLKRGRLRLVETSPERITFSYERS